MTKTIKVFLLFVAFTLGFIASGVAQIVVKTTPPYNTATNLVEGVLLGEGVKASNFSFSGHPSQVGYFQNGASFLGIDSGVVLSTGRVAEIQPPQPGNPWDGTGLSSGAADNDLFELGKIISNTYGIPALTSTEDAAILEFDFIPSSDSVVFRYVFASEEYPAYINKPYNDVFGFFISGPGISGPYSSPAGFPNGSENLAVVPGSTMPISVSSINANRNAQYYNVNTDQTSSFNFNGYTTVLYASAVVIPCQTYHIKLAIADGSKNDIDSGVLLEAGSFTSSGLSVEANVVEHQGEVLESCYQSHITLKRRGKLPYADSVFVSIYSALSQAVAADISPISSKPLIIPAGEDSVVFDFTVLADGITEGKEKLVFDFHLFSNCSDLHRTYTTYIDDATPLTFVKPQVGSINMRCYDYDTLLDAAVAGGYGSYSYSWTKNGLPIPDVSSSITVLQPAVTEVYKVTVGDACALQPISEQFVVNPPTQGFFTVDIAAGDTIKVPCRNQDYTFSSISLISLNGIASIGWSIDGMTFSSDTTPTVNVKNSGMYTVTMIDSCGQVAQDSVYLTFLNTTPLGIVTSPDTIICAGEMVSLNATAVGGSGIVNYSWSNGINAPTIIIAPSETNQYFITATDFCGTAITQSILVKVNVVEAIFEYEYDESDFGLIIHNYSIGENLKYSWAMDREAFSDKAEPYLNMGDVEDHVLELSIEDTLAGCLDMQKEVLLPQMFTYVPNAFTPNGDGYNDVFLISIVDPVDFEMAIYDRWGGLVFRSTDPSIGWDGTSVQTGQIVAGTYTFYVKASRSKDIRIDKSGIVRVEP